MMVTTGRPPDDARRDASADLVQVGMNKRLDEIHAKEQRYSHEIETAVERLKELNSVEARKRGELLRQFEEEDRRTRDAKKQREEDIRRRVRDVVQGTGSAIDLEALRRALLDGQEAFGMVDPEAEEFLREAEESLAVVAEAVQELEYTIAELRTSQAAEETSGGIGRPPPSLVRQLETVRALQSSALGSRLMGSRHPVAVAAVKATNEAQLLVSETTDRAADVVQAVSQGAVLQKRPGGVGVSTGTTGTTPADGMIQVLERVEAKVLQCALPDDVAYYLCQLEGQLRAFGETDGSVKTMLSVTSVAQKLMRAGASLGGDGFSCVLCRLLSAALRGACASSTASHITTLANVLVGMFQVLPDASGTEGGQSLLQKGAALFKAMLYRESRLCVPDLFHPSAAMSDDAGAGERRKHRLNCSELFGALIGTQNKAAPLSPEEGWSWLIKIGKQLHQASHRRLAAKGNEMAHLTYLEQESCSALFVTLRQCCAALITRFGWPTMRDALVALHQVATADGPLPALKDSVAGVQLSQWVAEVVRTDGMKATERLKKHEPHVMAAYMIISSVDEARSESEEIDRTRAGPVWAEVKRLKLHTSISGVYNRLGKTAESQQLVVNMLLEKVVTAAEAAAQCQMPQILKYSLCKIASELIAVAESENFIMNDISNPLPLARVAAGLCLAKPDIAEILKAELYRVCPLTVPRQPEPGLSGPAVLENMGFKDKESKDEWQGRMNRILCTFAVIVIQPEGVPFSLADGWAWLANMVNACSRVNEPHFFTSDALQIFLSITSPEMIRKYGSAFVQLLQVVQRDILPKLAGSDSKSRLTEFLDGAIRSNGRQLKPFFKT